MSYANYIPIVFRIGIVFDFQSVKIMSLLIKLLTSLIQTKQ